jgi:hypothetical protein
MLIFFRGAAELLPLDLEKDDTVQDIRVSLSLSIITIQMIIYVF